MEDGTTPLIFNATLGTLPTATNGFDFSAQTGRNAISLSKIRNFSFNAGTGGTIVLGGTANGNGLLKVKDSSGGTVVTMDNTGIKIFGGSITIYNSAGSAVIDSSGVNSLNNFVTVQNFNAAGTDTTTSTSFLDVTGGNMGTIITTRSIVVLFGIMAYGRNSDFINSTATHNLEVHIYDSFLASSIMNVISGGEAATLVTFPGPGTTSVSSAVADSMATRYSLVRVDAGTHVYKLRYRAGGGGGTVFLDAYDGEYTILGY